MIFLSGLIDDNLRNDTHHILMILYSSVMRHTHGNNFLKLKWSWLLLSISISTYQFHTFSFEDMLKQWNSQCHRWEFCFFFYNFIIRLFSSHWQDMFSNWVWWSTNLFQFLHQKWRQRPFSGHYSTLNLTG